MLETKCIKNGGKSLFSVSFLSSTVNDVRRKLYMVGIHSTVEKRAKRMPDTTVETTSHLPEEQSTLDICGSEVKTL